MVPVTFWLQLLLVDLILRQSAAASDQCSELREEISVLERDIVRITAQKHNYETQAGNCREQLTKQIHVLQRTEALHNNLKKQLEAKEEVLKNITDKQTQMQTAIDGLTKTVESLNQKAALRTDIDGLTKAVESLNQKAALQTAIDGLTKTVELINQRSQVLRRSEKDVCPSLLDAAKSGDVNIAKVSFKCSSSDSCNDNDRYRSTPLTYAAIYGHLEVVRMFLEEGANVNRTDSVVYTALHHAAWNGHLAVCRLLLDWGAKVDALNKSRNTPLIWAAWQGRLSIGKLLVERGADVSLKNVDGHTALDFARREGKTDVAEWLDSVSRRKGR